MSATIPSRPRLPSPQPPQDLFDRLRRFTRAEYHKMLDAGILSDGEPVELLEGLVVCKMSRNPPHDAALDLFRAAIGGLIPAGHLLRSQQAVSIDGSEPEPDFAVVRGGPRSFVARHPGPPEILLLVEVADSSLDDDRELKGTAYARNRVPVYWIVNVQDGHIEVYTDPDSAGSPPAYRARTDYVPGQHVPLTLDGVTVGHLPVADLLP